MILNCAWNELLAVVPPWLRNSVDRLGREDLQELRLRAGAVPVLVNARGRNGVERPVTGEDLQYVLNMACRYSPWTVRSVAQGYVTIQGGHRIGLCGQVLIRHGQMCGMGKITSMNIRVCRDFPGISRTLAESKGSVLILGPPGSGKTTLLRDLIRGRSARENVAVVDERGEIFPVRADFPVGENTDVICGCSKEQGIERVLRVMGPQCIAVDEITKGEDCDGLLQAGKCGVTLLATAHATDVSDLYSRPVYRRLMESRLFDQAVILRSDKSWRTERLVYR